MVVNANNLAIVPVVGRCIGSGDDVQAQIYTKKLMKISYISGKSDHFLLYKAEGRCYTENSSYTIPRTVMVTTIR